MTSRFFLDAGDPRLPEGYRVIGGPYEDQDIAIARARPDTLYPHLFRQAMKAGVLRAMGGHSEVSYQDVADWTGFSIDALRSWTRPKTSDSYRPMPRSAIRLILHEFKARDQSTYTWDRLLALCR